MASKNPKQLGWGFERQGQWCLYHYIQGSNGPIAKETQGLGVTSHSTQPSLNL
jgi:hypothetical protein